MDHLNHVNKNNAGIKPTSYKEYHNHTHTKPPSNSSSHTKEKVKISETKMVNYILFNLRNYKPLDSKLSQQPKKNAGILKWYSRGIPLAFQR